ncbi:MAG: hypothetical protein HZB18_00450 [Chloroflexi bacterium]|nr:hypothetical protein [Chloroflexota bacterium]
MNTQKKSLLISLLLGVALLFGITQSISANASQPYQTPPSPTPEVLENGWYRFTDEEAGYSFDYPPEFVLIQTSKNKGNTYKIVYIQFVSPEVLQHGYQGMTIFVEPNPESLPVENFIPKYYTKITHKILTTNSFSPTAEDYLMIDGKQAIKTTLITSGAPSTFLYNIIFVNNDKAFVVGPSFAIMDDPEDISPQTEELFLEILSTFSFSQ